MNKKPRISEIEEDDSGSSYNDELIVDSIKNSLDVITKI